MLIAKPLPSATDKDLYDQFWYGDPYSDVTPAGPNRGIFAAERLIGLRESQNAQRSDPSKSPGFEFVELVETAAAGAQYTRLSKPSPSDKAAKVGIERPTSRFVVSWEDISTPEDGKYWVAGSRLRVVDSTDNTVVAERVGYFIEAGFGSTAGQRRPWLTSRGPNTTCPPIKDSFNEDRFFIHKALNPMATLVSKEDSAERPG